MASQKKIKKYIDIFIKNVPVDLEQLVREINSSDFENSKKTAHKIKGNLGYMGVYSIQDSILYLEKIDLENIHEDEIKNHLSIVEKEIILILEELRTLN